MAIQWNQVKPDFSGSSASMKNAMTGISQAGTVFEKMREGILAEEQRAIENARAQDTLNEQIRANQALEEYRAGQLANEQARLEQQALVDAAQIAQYNANTNKANYELKQLRNNDAAWKFANDAVANLDSDYRAFAQASANLNVTEDDFNKNKDSLYKDYTDYKSFRNANTQVQSDIVGKYKKLGITGNDLTGLGNTTGRVGLLEKLYLQNGGTGSIESRLSLVDRAGLATEQKQLETARTVAAEDVKREKELGTSEGIQKAFSGFDLKGPDLLHVTQMAKMIQTAAKNNKVALKNSDAVNKVLMSIQMAKDPTSAAGKAWQWFAGKDSISFKSQEELDSILAEAFGTKSATGNNVNNGSGNKTKLPTLPELREQYLKDNPNASYNEADTQAQNNLKQLQKAAYEQQTSTFNKSLNYTKLKANIPEQVLRTNGIKDLNSVTYSQLYPVLMQLGLDIADFTNNKDLINDYNNYISSAY